MVDEHVPEDSTPKTSHTKTLTVHLNPWWLVAVLSIVVLVGVVVWQPWQGMQRANARTVEVSGSATVQAEPDEYVFMPSYEFEDSDKAAGLTALTSKSDEVIAGLKKLGVADADIVTNANSYRDYYVYNETTNTNTYTLTVTATVNTRDMAQKTQDYLITTGPTGSISPQYTLSTSKQKKVESQGRDEAAKDARAKAEQQAKNLGFKLGEVKSVSDTGYDGGIIPMMSGSAADAVSSSTTKLAIQPGQNDVTYAVQVTYYIR